MERGFIKIYRKISDKGWFKNSKYVHLWLYLIIKANHKENEFMWNGKIIKVKEGQLITGRDQLVKETSIKGTTIERILKTFENEHQIGQQKTNKYRLITILNWDKHQKRTSERTTNGQQTDTNKNYKNDKKEDNVAKATTDSLTKQKNNQDILTLMDLFKDRYGIYPQPVKKGNFDLNRMACKWLISTYGLDGAKSKILKIFEAMDKDQFCPQATKPLDIKNKMSDYIEYFKKHSND